MHLDLEQADAGTALRGRVCVVGAGIAGLLLSVRLAERGVDVLLLEAGGLELEERSQALYEAEMAEARHAGTTEGRFRTFGGSSTRWGGQLLPYTADIFAPIEGEPSAGWPIGEAEVAPYYAELQRVLGVDALPFDAGLLPALGREPVGFSDAVTLRFSKWIPFARRNLARTLGKEALASPRVTVVTHANVAELEAGGSGRVQAARVLDYAGRPFRAEADTFVVATGTVESARLLLLSPGAVPDAHQQVGRYFHDHISLPAAEFRGPARARVLERLGPFFTAGTLHTCKLEASATLRARERMLAAMAHVTIEEPEDSGPAALRGLLRSVQQGKLGAAVGENLPALLRGAGDVARLAWYSRFKQRRAVSARATVRLTVDLEQPASAANCVRLSGARDALGLRKAVVDWRVGPRERETAAAYARVIRAELERLGMAPEGWDEALLRGEAQFADTFHPMGGLRMGTDPIASVVAPDLRVHGVENLYVASCAVYPSGGSSNPTFTLMCLAMRLADRLAAG